MRTIRWIFDLLPAFSGLLLGAIGLGVIFFMPELDNALKNRKRLRRLMAVLILAVGIGGVISDRVQDAERKTDQASRDAAAAKDRQELRSQMDAIKDGLKNQARTLALPTVGATPDDIRNLRSDISVGFERMGNAVASLGAKIPPKIEVKVPPPPTIVPNVTMTQRRVPSRNPLTPYVLQVIIQTDASIEPASFVIDCDAEIESATFFVTGQIALVNERHELSADKKAFALRFGAPPFTPETPIVVTLVSRTDVRVSAIRKWR